jgi:hypothetical protein
MLGLIPPDVRYSADSSATAAAAGVLLPLRVTVHRPTGEQALAEAKQVVEQFRILTERSERPPGRIALADPAQTYENQSGHLTIHQHAKKEVKLDLDFLALVSFPGAGAGDFWARAAVLAWATDLVQQFCLQTWPKGVEVAAQLGKFLGRAEPSGGSDRA